MVKWFKVSCREKLREGQGLHYAISCIILSSSSLSKLLNPHSHKVNIKSLDLLNTCYHLITLTARYEQVKASNWSMKDVFNFMCRDHEEMTVRLHYMKVSSFSLIIKSCDWSKSITQVLQIPINRKFAVS